MALRLLLLLLLAIVVAVVASAKSPTPTQAPYPPTPASCNSPISGKGGYNCSNRPATIAVHTAAPTFVKSVRNGKRFLAGSGHDTFHVAHLYSDTDDLYEMGKALGELFPNEINDMFDHIEPWLAERLERAVKWLPKFLADLVVDLGVPAALDVVYDLTKDYIPKPYLDEWQGIADGANCSIQRIRRVALFPQLSKAACTILIAHNNATASEGIAHLRALDFDPTSNVSDFASVVVYHYKHKPKLANFAWIAMTGVLTGMNDVPISVGEKAWGGGHNAFLGLPIGLPWMQMLRRSLELRNLTAINSYITANDRATATQPGNSVDFHVGYADQSSNHIKGYEVGYNYSKAFDWNTHRPSRTHPLYDGIVYWSKNDPAHTMCPADMLTNRYGNIDAEWMAMYYSPNDKTGDTQMAAFDLKGMKVWFANSRKTTAPYDTPYCAYWRQRTVLDMAKIFDEPKPANL